MMRPASEISFIPIDTPAAAAKVRMIGRRECEASSGASSTLVYTISGVFESDMTQGPFIRLRDLYRFGMRWSTMDERSG